jgi:hypothetical protein
MFRALICSSSGGTVYTTIGIFCACYVGQLLAINTLRAGDANLRHLRFLHYNCERQMTEICLLTRAWFLST